MVNYQFLASQRGSFPVAAVGERGNRAMSRSGSQNLYIRVGTREPGTSLVWKPHLRGALPTLEGLFDLHELGEQVIHHKLEVFLPSAGVPGAVFAGLLDHLVGEEDLGAAW